MLAELLLSFIEVLKELDKLYQSYDYSAYMPNLCDIAKWMEDGCQLTSYKSISTGFWGKCTQFISLKKPLKF